MRRPTSSPMTACRWLRRAVSFCCAGADDREGQRGKISLERNFATPRNNEFGFDDQRNSHSRQGAGTTGANAPALPVRFLEPSGFVWGSLPTRDGARLRWGHLPANEPRAECVLVGGFAECIEKYFETISDLAVRRYSVWCLDWRGQGGSARPRRLPSRPRPRHFDRDASELASFTERLPAKRLPRLLIGHSMGVLRHSFACGDIRVCSTPQFCRRRCSRSARVGCPRRW